MTKIILGVVILVALSGSAEATPIAVGESYAVRFHAETCADCPFVFSPLPEITMDGVLTAIDVTNAEFPDTVFPTFYPNATMVTDLIGTLNVNCVGIATCVNGSYTLSFLANDRGDGSFLLSSIPMFLTFATEAGDGRIFNDHAFNYYSGPGTQPQIPVRWNATRVPDSASSLLLFAIGLVIIGALRFPAGH